MTTLNWGHRGASHDSPENTLASFRLAQAMGADGVELDVRLSRDGVPVVMHDATVDRTTDGSGAVDDLNLAELKALDAGRWFAEQFAGEQIPTLMDVFEAVGPDMLMNLELKPAGDCAEQLAAGVAECVERYGMMGRVLISCFDPLVLCAVYRIQTALPLAFLYGPLLSLDDLLRIVSSLPRLVALHPEHRWVTPDRVAWARAQGFQVNAWTVDEPDEMRRLIDPGVDGIITNRPGVLREVLRVDSGS